MNDLVLSRKGRRLVQAQGAGSGQRLFSDYAPRFTNMALDEFMVWFRLEAAAGLQQSHGQRWRASLEPASSVHRRSSSACRPSASWPGRRSITGCSRRSWRPHQPRKERQIDRSSHGELAVAATGAGVLGAPDAATMKGLRDRAILEVLIGFGVRDPRSRR